MSPPDLCLNDNAMKEVHVAITEAAAPPRTRQNARRWTLSRPALVVALLMVVGMGALLYPKAAAWTTQKNHAAALSAGSRTILSRGEQERRERLEEAHRYNAALASGALVEANANVPTGAGSGAEDYDYWEMLKSSTDIMARLRYEKAEIDLPVYHGTSDGTLLRGAGHLQGTSLPVGGVGTHSVLTGHRGLAEATMFTHLDKAEEGDVFTIEVEGEAISYRVFDIRVVEPEDTESLRADPNRDLVTLITCTPLGINTQRILVTGERVTPTPLSALEGIGGPSGLPGFPWWALLFGGTVVASIVYVWRAGYPAEPKKVKNPAESAPQP